MTELTAPMAIDGFFLTGAVLELFCNLEKPLQKQPFPCIHLLLFVILEQNDKNIFVILSKMKKICKIDTENAVIVRENGWILFSDFLGTISKR